MSLINWRLVSNGLPDAGITVFIAMDTGPEPTWLGYWDGEQWMTVEGVPAGPIAHWAHMPRSPMDTSPVSGDELYAAMRLILAGLPKRCELSFFWRDGEQHMTSTHEGIAETCKLVRPGTGKPAVIKPAQVH